MSNEASGYINIPKNLDLLDDEEVPDTVKLVRKNTRAETSEQLPTPDEYLSDVMGIDQAKGFDGMPDNSIPTAIQPQIPVVNTTIKPVEVKTSDKLKLEGKPEWLKKLYQK